MRRSWILALIVVGGFFAQVSPAATLTVDLGGGADYTDIQSAIDAAADGDTVLAKPGEYVITESINFNRLHAPEDPASPPVKNIVVRSEGGANVTTILMSSTPLDPHRASVVVFEHGEAAGSILEGFWLSGGNCSLGTPGGGGVYCGEGSSPTLRNCTISGNSAGWYGGGVDCWGFSPTLTDCTISGNSAFGGGGVYCHGGSSPTLTNCTISENRAEEDGGGVDCWGSSPTLTNCTISGNSANDGAGVYCGGGSSPTLTSCIVWEAGPNESGCGVLSSCLTDENPLFVRPGEWIDCASRYDPLCIGYHWDATTGKPTAWGRWVEGDYHLQPGSPAIDAGTSEGAPTTDMDGNARPCGAGVDIGAYEYGDCWPSTRFRRGDANADGSVNITDGIFALNYLFLGGPAAPCADAADLDDGGGVNITDAVYLLSFLFISGPAPAAPFDACGIDPTLDELDCEAFPPCG